MSLRRTRLLKELAQLENDFSHEGIKFKSEENLETLKFEILGPNGTPFSNEVLQLEMKLTNRYPLEPPILRFTTPLRHPNIDEVSGRICLDLLRMPPEGSWKPNVSLGSVLVSVHVLLGSPNLDDPVRPDLISEWQNCEIDSIKNKENEMLKMDKCDSGYQNNKYNTKRDFTISENSKRNFSLSLSSLRKKPKIQKTETDEPK